MDRPWRFAAASPERRRALELARRVSASNCPVLIVGPTGVGKDVLAEDIHAHSPRARRRLVPVNCAAVPGALFESELFGHRRGAYTGAAHAKPGLVELAHEGTLFLDEVGELPIDAQAKLLRFLSRGTFWPLGGAEERAADVRVIAATNRDLAAMLDGAFREDLFFRLSVVTITLPPLAPDDVRLLAREMAADIAARAGTRVGARELAAIAERASGRALRGGARELYNVLERFFLLWDPAQPVEEGWRQADALDALAARAPRGRATPAGSDEGCGGAAAPPPDGALGSALRDLDDLLFLLSARSAPSVRDLSRRLDRSLQTVYERLRRLGLKPQQLGRDELDQAIARTRRALAPHGAWLQDALKGLQET